MICKNQNGFTLIELIVVIALAAVLIGIAFFYMGSTGENSRLRAAAADLASDMTLARISAIRDTTPWAIRFDPNNNFYVILNSPGEIFQDPADPIDWNDGDETSLRTVNLPKRIEFGSNQGELKGVAVGDGVSFANELIVFNPNGTCSGAGTVYLTAANGRTYAITSLASTGRLKLWQNFGSGWSF